MIHAKVDFFLMGLGLELRASCLQSRHSTTWNTPPTHFVLVILEGEGLSNYLPGLALNHNPLNLSFPNSYDYRVSHQHHLVCRFYFILAYHYFSFGSTGVWTQGFTLVRQVSTTWAMPSALIYLFILRWGFSVRTGLEPMFLLPQSPECWNYSGVPPHPAGVFFGFLKTDSCTHLWGIMYNSLYVYNV
jgi:hypothetical protein